MNFKCVFKMFQEGKVTRVKSTRSPDELLPDDQSLINRFKAFKNQLAISDFVIYFADLE